MRIPLFQVDAFTDVPFGGNPAAVCLANDPLDAALMQQIAAEMNLSETAFPEPIDADGRRGLRWFTPALEIPLCGHATLATAKVLFDAGATSPIRFVTKSGELVVHAESDGRLRMDFPVMHAEAMASPAGLLDALGCAPNAASARGPAGQYWLVEVDSETDVAGLSPDFGRLGAVDLGDRVGVAVTAPGDAADVDFVSRFFAPWAGIDEDPVTGSSHCMLGPWWSEKLRKTELQAVQISDRIGTMEVRIREDRVHLVGRAVTVSEGTLLLPDS